MSGIYIIGPQSINQQVNKNYLNKTTTLLQPCQVSRILHESRAFSVDSRFFACLSFISRIFIFSHYFEKTELFSLGTISKLTMHKNVSVAVVCGFRKHTSHEVT